MQRIFTSITLAGAAAMIVLACIGCSRAGPAPIRVLMITGGEYHDYETLPPELASRLTGRGETDIEITRDLSTLNEASIAPYDVLLFNTCTQETLDEAARGAIIEHVRSGKGLVSMHASLRSFRWWPQWAEMLGAVSCHLILRLPSAST